MTLRIGQLYRRHGDGFVFRVTSTSRVNPGAAMQCVDATMIFGWYSADQIASGFDRVKS